MFRKKIPLRERLVELSKTRLTPDFLNMNYKHVYDFYMERVKGMKFPFQLSKKNISMFLEKIKIPFLVNFIGFDNHSNSLYPFFSEHPLEMVNDILGKTTGLDKGSSVTRPPLSPTRELFEMMTDEPLQTDRQTDEQNDPIENTVIFYEEKHIDILFYHNESKQGHTAIVEARNLLKKKRDEK